jgi:hypothetical protein
MDSMDSQNQMKTDQDDMKRSQPKCFYGNFLCTAGLAAVDRARPTTTYFRSLQ